MRQNYEQLLKKGYNAQKIKPTKGDWYTMIQEETNKFEIDETDEQIAKMSKSIIEELLDFLLKPVICCRN